MATGTGLPIPKPGGTVAQAPGFLDGDRLASASAWRQIAADGEKVASAGTSLLQKEIHEQQAKQLADFELEHADYYNKLRDQRAFDPKGFDADAHGHNDGAMAAVPRWMEAHAKRFLGGKLEAGLSTVLSETRARDRQLAAQSLEARVKSSDDEIMGLAMAGKVGTPAWNAAQEARAGILETAVSAGLMAPDKAAYLDDDLHGRAQGEIAARTGIEIYREKGYEAAVAHLRANVLENDKLTLKPAEKQKAFNRGLAAINLERRIDREDRVGIVSEAKDTIDRIKANQPVDAGQLRDQLQALKRVGAWGQYRDLYVESQVSTLTAPYRSGAVRPSEFARTIEGIRNSPTPEKIGAINTTAARLGVNARDLAAAISYETGGTFDPNKVGGKGNNYLGLIQFGPEERAKYGVRPGMTFEQQMGAVEAFLRDRGVKPGMGISEIYRTINGGNPNASLNASDGNGTIAEHIARIQSGHYASADKFLGSSETDAQGVPFAGAIVRRAQAEFASQMRKEWPDFKAQIAAGKEVDADDFEAVRMAAAVSGDAAWLKDVEESASARALGKVIGTAPVGQGQAALDEVKQKFSDGVAKIVQQQFDRRLKMVTDDPVGFAVENGRAPPAPLTFGNAAATQQAVTERVNIARAVAEDQGVAPGNPFRPAERAAIAAAITSGKPAEAQAALDALAGVADDFLVPAIKAPEIKSNIEGLTRSTDPARFTAAMQALDRMYRRAPDEMVHLFDKDTIKTMQDWQAKLRYYRPEELAEQLRRRDDPQVREQMQLNVREGEKIARERKPESLIGEWQGFLGLSGASMPTDQRTRDAWMADYVNIFGERYAASLDRDTAHRQTIERMKPYWNPSQVNGGRLTLYAPETVYQPVNGSYEWMREQLGKDITAKLGRAPSDYLVVADAITERNVTAREPASYLVAVKNDQTGEWDLWRGADNRPQRYRWDSAQPRANAREEFERQRQRVFNAPPGVAANMSWIN